MPDGSQFGPQLQAILDAAAGKASAAGQRIGQNVGQGVIPQMQMVNRSIMDAGAQFDMAARKALVFTGAVMGTKATVEGLVNKLAGLFDQLAQAQAGFTAISGERRGGELLEEIRQFAKESPFVTQQLVNYSQQLLGVGMSAEKIVPLLKDTGNVISSVGGDTANLGRVLYAFSQIQTVGRLTGQDAMQLQSSLIPITKMLASFLGKTTQEVKKLQEQGRISAEQVFAAISAAGQKVPNAMNNAVRNIAGARAVLSDTITILMQDAPALRNIYDDVVKGIQTVAAVLSSEEVSGAIGDAFEAIGSAYEAIKPTIAEFISAMGENSMSVLKMFTEVVGALAKAVSAIPQPVLDALAQTLAIIATLKAPMMLIKYVEQFQQMASIFKADTIANAIKRVTGAQIEAQTPTQKLMLANERLAASYRDVAVAASAAAGGISGHAMPGGAAVMGQAYAGLGMRDKLSLFRTGAEGMTRGQMARNMLGGPAARMAGAVGLMAGGQIASNVVGQESTGGQVIAGASQYAAYGAMLGPWGALGGAAIGGMMSFFSAQKKAAEAHRKEMEDIGRATGEDYINEVDMAFGAAPTAKSIGMIQERITAIQNEIRTRYKESRDALNAELMADAAANYDYQMSFDTGTAGPRAEAAGRAMAMYEAVTGNPAADLDLEGTDPIIKLRTELETLQSQIDPITGDIQDKLKKTFEMLSPEAAKEFMATFGAAGPGYYTFKSIEDMEAALRQFGLTFEEVIVTPAEDLARIQELFNGIADAEKNAATRASFIGQQYEQAARQSEELWGSRSKALGFEIKTLQELKSATDAVTKAYLNKGNQVAQLTGQQAVLNAKTATYNLEYAKAMDELVYGKKMLIPEAEIIARERALKIAEKTARELTVVSVSSINDMAKTYGYSQEQLQKLLGLQGKIDKDMKITVTVAMDEAMRKLQTLNAAIETIGRNLDNVYKYGGTGNFAMNFKKMESLGVTAAQQRSYIQDLVERQTGEPAKSGGGGQSFSDKVKSAAQMLENSIKSAMESVKGAAEAWKATIKDRVQYEAAVSTGRALRNVQRQATDIGALTSGIAQLKARGLSEEALTALDINAITDVRQVKRLLSASPEELKRLSTAVAQRDKLASTLASERQREENRKTITQAILEAARILGYKFTEAQAKAISAQFNITTDTDAKRMIEDILRALSGGKITSVPT